MDQETGVCDGMVGRSGENVPCGAQLREVRQLPLVHPLLGELGVGAVEAEDDELGGRLGRLSRQGRRGEGEESEDAEL